MLKEDSFAEGLFKLNMRGAYVVPVRINKRMKEILWTMISEDYENVSVKYDVKENDDQYNNFMQAMSWLENKLHFRDTKDNPPIKIRFSPQIAYTLHFWVIDHRNHHLSGSPDFDNAMQWITNQWNSKYSQNKLMELKACQK